MFAQQCCQQRVLYASKASLTTFEFIQILNRTNNIFELVTVEAVPEVNDGQSKMNILLNETDGDEDKNLRLKGCVALGHFDQNFKQINKFQLIIQVK